MSVNVSQYGGVGSAVASASGGGAMRRYGEKHDLEQCVDDARKRLRCVWSALSVQFPSPVMRTYIYLYSYARPNNGTGRAESTSGGNIGACNH